MNLIWWSGCTKGKWRKDILQTTGVFFTQYGYKLWRKYLICIVRFVGLDHISLEVTLESEKFFRKSSRNSEALLQDWALYNGYLCKYKL